MVLTPWMSSGVPVSSAMCAGSVQLVVLTARSKSRPWAASSRSTTGVVAMSGRVALL
jgi:hypothetical protein